MVLTHWSGCFTAWNHRFMNLWTISWILIRRPFFFRFSALNQNNLIINSLSINFTWSVLIIISYFNHQLSIGFLSGRKRPTRSTSSSRCKKLIAFAIPRRRYCCCTFVISREITRLIFLGTVFQNFISNVEHILPTKHDIFSWLVCFPSDVRSVLVTSNLPHPACKFSIRPLSVLLMANWSR